VLFGSPKNYSGAKEEAAKVLIQAFEKVHAGEVWLEGSMIASVLRDR